MSTQSLSPGAKVVPADKLGPSWGSHRHVRYGHCLWPGCREVPGTLPLHPLSYPEQTHLQSRGPPGKAQGAGSGSSSSPAAHGGGSPDCDPEPDAGLDPAESERHRQHPQVALAKLHVQDLRFSGVRILGRWGSFMRKGSTQSQVQNDPET